MAALADQARPVRLAQVARHPDPRPRGRAPAVAACGPGARAAGGHARLGTRGGAREPFPPLLPDARAAAQRLGDQLGLRRAVQRLLDAAAAGAHRRERGARRPRGAGALLALRRHRRAARAARRRGAAPSLRQARRRPVADAAVRVLAFLLLAACAAAAPAADWRMDAVASRLEFVAAFEKNPALGFFKVFDVKLKFDPAQLQGSRLDVVIQVPSADMGMRDVNAAIRGAEWFDFARFPQAEFHAEDIRKAGDAFVARGTLLLKGVKQAVEVPFTWRPTAEGAAMEGELAVKRAAFGIGTGEWTAT